MLLYLASCNIGFMISHWLSVSSLVYLIIPYIISLPLCEDKFGFDRRGRGQHGYALHTGAIQQFGCSRGVADEDRSGTAMVLHGAASADCSPSGSRCRTGNPAALSGHFRKAVRHSGAVLHRLWDTRCGADTRRFTGSRTVQKLSASGFRRAGWNCTGSTGYHPTGGRGNLHNVL